MLMKICKVCLESDILCSACNRRLESGVISRVDVDLSHAIYKFGKEKSINIDFLSSIESDGRVFVVVESRHAAKFIGPGGRNIKKISEMLGRQVKLIEKSEGSEKQVIEKMIGAPVLGINKTYSPAESYKVRVERRYARLVQPLGGVVGKALGKNISFIFE